MNDMVDPVKAAIAAKLAPAIDVRAPYAKVMFEEAARAAIAAMREPTEAMIVAGADLRTREPRTGSWDSHQKWTAEGWTAMIDAALAD